MKVLLIEDDPALGRGIERGLGEEGHLVRTAQTGRDGIAEALSDEYDAIILDVLLPEMDGLQVCRTLRQGGTATPIVMLTALDTIPDRIKGLDAGADDYMVKPFSLDELLARLRALVRRGRDPAEDGRLQADDLVLDVARHEVQRSGKPIDLTSREFDLLVYLLRNVGRVVTQEQILQRVWGSEADKSSNIVEIYIHYLRNKVDRGFESPLIRTIRGVGYTLKPS